jgi:hypothetical protein
LRVWRSPLGAGVLPAFPPGEVVEIKALACELPSQLGIPLSRFSTKEIDRAAMHRGIVASIGATTVWRWLSADAIRPWTHRTWIFPRDPNFREKAGRVLDLYEGRWNGSPLGSRDCVVSTDEMTSIQARMRIHPTKPPASGQAMKVEHEYRRGGAWAYFAAWDVRRAKVQWIMDNGSSHRGERSDERLRRRWPNIVVVHTPVHASWLNQVEIYFSIIQRKVLTPNDFWSVREVSYRLLAFQKHYEQVARPFDWQFTRQDLDRLLRRLERRPRVAA